MLVTCDRKDKENGLYKQHPLFIAEVLSPSTEAFDRGRKFSAYRQLDSLQAYWLIDSQKMSLDCFTRTATDEWLLHSYDQARAIVPIASLEVDLLLQELYEDTPAAV